MAVEKQKKEDAETSGLSDILEIAAALGTDEEEESGPSSVVRADASDDEGPDDLSSGYGAAAAASLVPTTPDPDADVLEPANRPSDDAPAKAKHESPKKTGEPAKIEPEPKPEPASRPEAEPVPVAARSKDAAKPAEPERRGGTVWLLAVGAAALAGIVFFATQNQGTDEPEPKAVAAASVESEPEDEVEPPPVEPEEKPEPVAAGDTDDGEPAAADTDEEVVEMEDEEEEEEAAEGDAEPTVVASSRKGERRRAKDEADKPAPKPEPAPEPESEEPKEPPPPPEPEPEPVEEKPTPSPEDDAKFSSECLLNPSKPGCAEFNEKRKQKQVDVDATLPEKLSHTQIRQGITPLKSKAKACGSKHGAAPGTKIRVKLSIEGNTGKVVAASAMAPHDGDPVGQCVADVLKEATFPRFKTGQQGTVYPVTM